MTTTIPHSAVIKNQLNEYLDDAQSILKTSFDEIDKSPAFRAIYKNCVGTFTPLTRIASRQLPLLKTASGIVKRSPLLIASRQMQLAYVELRRLIETVNCYPYFSEHPVEWESFADTPSGGYAKDTDKPIFWNAHREQKFYSNYIRERFAVDKSGLIELAVNDNNQCYKDFSAYVHAALNHLTKKPLTHVFDTIDEDSLKDFADAQKRVYRATLILSLAPKPTLVGKLSAIERAWFDWVLGNANQKKIRAGDFLQ